MKIVLPDGVDPDTLIAMFSRMMQVFDNPDDLRAIMGLIQYPEVSENFGNLASAMASIDPKHLQGSAEALAKLTPEIMDQLQGLLAKLEIDLPKILLDPGIFLEFLSDPEKAKILNEVQNILPPFTPKDLNDLLSVKLEIDEKVPNADKIMEKLFQLPFSAVGKVIKVVIISLQATLYLSNIHLNNNKRITPACNA